MGQTQKWLAKDKYCTNQLRKEKDVSGGGWNAIFEVSF